MDDKVMLWRLGILVLSTILVAATLILYLGRGFQATYQLTLLCNEAPNVTPETPVHRNGVLIGRVDKVETLDEGGVKMTLRINKGVRLFTDEVARIGMTSILGESVIEFVPGRGNRKRELLEHKNTLGQDSVEVSPGPMEMVNLAFERAAEFEKKFDKLQDNIIATSDSIRGASAKFDKLATTINDALGDDSANDLGNFFKTLRELGKNTDSMVQKFTEIGNDIRQITGDPKTQMTLKSTVEKFPKLIDSAQGSLDEFRETSSLFKEVAKDAKIQLDNISKITEPLADPEFVDSIRGSLKGVEKFLSSIKDSKGTIGLLLNDPSVYNRMNNSLRRIESITYKLEPILRDVRVFSSKIATDPRQLGVKGALDRRPSGTGVKGNFLVPQEYEAERWTPRDLFRE